MLRVFKVTSPMNVGALDPRRQRRRIEHGRSARAVRSARARVRLAAELVAALFGPPLATYTGVLLADTAVPVWHEARQELPWLFGASAAASAGAAACLFVAPADAGPARRLAVGGVVAENALIAAMEHRLGEVGEVYRQGRRAAWLSREGAHGRRRAACLRRAASEAVRRRPSAARSCAPASCACAGRCSRPGFQSARDPKYTVKPQRERAERDGTKATTSPVYRRRRPVDTRLVPELGFALSSEDHEPRELVRQAMLAERSGFTFCTISDHYHPWIDAQGHSAFVWATLGAIAQATETIACGTGVTCPMIRIHPAIVAQAAATVATMMPGRFRLGVGTGENLNEHVLGDRWPLAGRAPRDARGGDRGDAAPLAGRRADAPRQALHGRPRARVRPARRAGRDLRRGCEAEGRRARGPDRRRLHRHRARGRPRQGLRGRRRQGEAEARDDPRRLRHRRGARARSAPTSSGRTRR